MAFYDSRKKPDRQQKRNDLWRDDHDFSRGRSQKDKKNASGGYGRGGRMPNMPQQNAPRQDAGSPDGAGT